MANLTFPLSDLYPTLGGVDTSEKVTPHADHQDALNEDVEVAETASSTEASRKSVFLAILVMVLLIVFFGGGK